MFQTTNSYLFLSINKLIFDQICPVSQYLVVKIISSMRDSIWLMLDWLVLHNLIIVLQLYMQFISLTCLHPRNVQPSSLERRATLPVYSWSIHIVEKKGGDTKLSLPGDRLLLSFRVTSSWEKLNSNIHKHPVFIIWSFMNRNYQDVSGELVTTEKARLCLLWH